MAQSVERITELAKLKELVSDFDELFALKGNFWKCLQSGELKFDSPDQLEELSRDLLVELFGLEVQGL